MTHISPSCISIGPSGQTDFSAHATFIYIASAPGRAQWRTRRRRASIALARARAAARPPVRATYRCTRTEFVSHDAHDTESNLADTPATARARPELEGARGGGVESARIHGYTYVRSGPQV